MYQVCASVCVVMHEVMCKNKQNLGSYGWASVIATSSILCITDLHTVPNFCSIFCSIAFSWSSSLAVVWLFGIIGHLCSLIRGFDGLKVLTACFHPLLGSLSTTKQAALILVMLSILLCRSKKYNSKHPIASGCPLSLLYVTANVVLTRMSSVGKYMKG